MLRAVSLLGASAAALLVVRWGLRRVDALGRPRDFPVVSTTMALLVAVGAGVPVVRHARFEHTLSDVAAQLSGRQVTVRCETLSQAWVDAHAEAGYVWFDADGRPGTRATITADTCADLRRWATSERTRPDLDEVVAIHVLTHEAMHLAGLQNESAAECAAVQRDARTAVLLGARDGPARALAVRYWRDVYERLPDSYRSGDCGAGGALDERLPTAPWVSP